MAQLLGWVIVIGMVVAIGAVWFLFYPTGRLPKWLIWLLTIVIETVCFALLAGVIYGFQWGSVVFFAGLGVVAGVGGATWAEWSSVKRLFR